MVRLYETHDLITYHSHASFCQIIREKNIYLLSDVLFLISNNHPIRFYQYSGGTDAHPYQIKVFSQNPEKLFSWFL